MVAQTDQLIMSAIGALDGPQEAADGPSAAEPARRDHRSHEDAIATMTLRRCAQKRWARSTATSTSAWWLCRRSRRISTGSQRNLKSPHERRREGHGRARVA